MALSASQDRPGTSGRAEPASSSVSPAFEWLWQRLGDVRHPHVLDCGQVRQSTVDVLMKRGARLYVADLVTPLRRGGRDFWDRKPKQPIFLPERFLAQLPEIPAGTLSAIFCWHLLDLLPREPLPGIVERFCSLLQKGGALLCLLRDPYLASGAGADWWLESPTGLVATGQDRGDFAYPSLTNREMERLAPGCTIKTFLTRSGRREVLALK